MVWRPGWKCWHVAAMLLRLLTKLQTRPELAQPQAQFLISKTYRTRS